MATTLLHGAAIVTVDDEFTIHDPGWVLIENRRISEVGAGQPPQLMVRAVDSHLELTGQAVMPGMTNAHTHLFQAFFRGLADDKPLLTWLEDCIWPGAEHIDSDIAYDAARLGFVENLRGGATSIIDHQYVHPGATGDDIDDAVLRAADETGVRFTLAHGWADRNYFPSLTESSDVAIRRTTSAFEKWDGHDDERLRVGMAPLIPWGCSDEAVIETLATARRWNRGTHNHCAETKVEVDMSLEERGMRHVEWMHSLGMLGPDVQLAHSVWLDDHELDLIAESGSIVVHCPVSNMYLASGVARIVEMIERGITIALASDGPGSNNRQDMFEVLKAAVLLQKVHRLDAMALQPEQVLTMACRGGAAAFGTPSDFGCLAPGQRADLLVVDLNSPFVVPVHRVPSTLVFNATPRDILGVMVDGRWRILDGAFVDVDEEDVVKRANDSAATLFARAGIVTRLNRRPAI